MTIKNKFFKYSLLSSAILLASNVNAFELAQHGSEITSDSLESTHYTATVRTPGGETISFEINNSEFVLTPELLGLTAFENGLYKYELTPTMQTGSMAHEVRAAQDSSLTKNYTDAFQSNAEIVSGVFSMSDQKLVDSKLQDPEEMVNVGSTANVPQANSGVNGSVDRAQVFVTDVVVQGSICAGFDCVNGESFGFDTLRLKENNLRIRAQDTSTSASFPTRDWQITFNDTSNGGQNKFSIDDIDGGRTPFTIEAGAPSHSLYVEDGGRLGLGTSTPVTDIHVKSGNTPTLRLEQDGSSGFGAQTWDVAGNEANFFIRDATNGSALAFRIFPGSGTSNALNIGSNGDIGMGTTSPDDDLDIESSGPALRLTNTGSGGGFWRMFVKDDSARLNFTADPLLGIVPVKISETANHNLFKIGTPTSDTVEVTGNLNVSGNIVAMGTITPDYVFKSDYPLNSIEDHAKFMWENNHLPNVKAAVTTADGKGTFSLNQRSQELLEELEIAHIYIEQLNKRLNEKSSKLDAIEERLATLENNK